MVSEDVKKKPTLKKVYKEYRLDLLGLEGAHKQSISPYRFWYEHVRKNALKDDGDIIEFGVYRGRSLLTAALILKELNSKKKIYGFDTFKGFPSPTKFDDLIQFNNNKYFGKKIQAEVKKNFDLKKKITKIEKLNTNNISTSGNFNKTSYEYVMERIKYLKLKNVILIKGNISKTLPKFFDENKIQISSCNIDTDLYESYKKILPYVYSKLNQKGYIFLDEYYSLKFPGPKIATDEFCKKLRIKPKKHKVRIGEFDRYYITK